MPEDNKDWLTGHFLQLTRKTLIKINNFVKKLQKNQMSTWAENHSNFVDIRKYMKNLENHFNFVKKKYD